MEVIFGSLTRVLTGIHAWKFILVLSLALNVGWLTKFSFRENSSLSLRTEGEERRLFQEQFCHWKKESGSMNCGASKQDEDGAKAVSSDSVINLDHGDPTMFELFWRRMGEKSTIVIPGWQSMSYFSDIGNLCWFLVPEFAKQVRRLHELVGNAKTEDRHIVVGTGSTQLFQAVLYALSPPDATEPIDIVSAAPYYSSYPLMTEYLKSGLYKWAGDAYTYNKGGPYIELVTSPNNPDGYIRHPVVNRNGGTLVYDLAYYWPQYTPITSPADHDIMLFTVSKSTGHAGTRIGWALVKDAEIAKRMTKFIELNTIGVSKDSQLRAAKILEVVSDSCQLSGNPNQTESFFEHGLRLMTNRWERLRDAAKQNGMFSLPEFSSDFCNYAGKVVEPHPAFAWLKCEGDAEDCESFLREHKIITRSGKHFGVDIRYVRVSMLDRNGTFKLFVDRLSSIS